MPFTGRYTFSVQVHKGIIAGWLKCADGSAGASLSDPPQKDMNFPPNSLATFF